MKIPALLAALFALFSLASPALAQANAQSSPEDRQRLVTIVHNLERAPMSASARNDRAWAVQWVTDAPDVTVNICADLLGNVMHEHFAQSHEIVVQYAIGMAAFVIEHPDAANDPDAQQLAGVESALKAYQAMRAAKPDGKSSAALDDLLGKQSRGELPGFVRDAYRGCMAKSGK